MTDKLDPLCSDLLKSDYRELFLCVPLSRFWHHVVFINSMEREKEHVAKCPNFEMHWYLCVFPTSCAKHVQAGLSTRSAPHILYRIAAVNQTQNIYSLNNYKFNYKWVDFFPLKNMFCMYIYLQPPSTKLIFTEFSSALDVSLAVDLRFDKSRSLFQRTNKEMWGAAWFRNPLKNSLIIHNTIDLSNGR